MGLAALWMIPGCGIDRLPAEYGNIPVPTEQLWSSEAQDAGRALFQSYCALCHGDRADGRGSRTDLRGSPANLKDPLWREEASPRWVFYVVREGIRHTSMGSMKSVLSEEETWNIVGYVLAEPDEGLSRNSS